MTETSQGRPSTATLVLAAVLLLIVGGAAGFLIAHATDHHGSSSTSVSTPDPNTVTCGAFANLPADQKRSILAALNTTNDTHVSLAQLDSACPGLLAGTSDPVSGAVINLGDN